MSTSASSSEVFPPLYKKDVLACQYSSWYPTFRKHSPKASVIRPLTSEFIDYLETDGLFLPEGSGPMGISELSDSDSDDEGSRNGSAVDSEDEWHQQQAQVTFPELDAEIRQILLNYEGAVFPKLNWSSPQDAAWMIPGQTLKCQCPADVYLLLKSSDFISHDLDHAFDGCLDYEPGAPSAAEQEVDASADEGIARLSLSVGEEEGGASKSSDPIPTPRRKSKPYEFELVLKKWFDMPKAQEWRCFVRDRKLIAISQRDSLTYYDFLQPSSFQAELREKIENFWEEVVRDRFESESYTVDLYLTRSASPSDARVFVIDFNPYAPSTDALLFSWEELATLSSSPAPPSAAASASDNPDLDLPILRILSTEASQALPRFSHNRYPADMVQMSEGRSVGELAKEWAEKLAKGVVVDGEEESESDSEERRRRERVGR